LLAWGANYGKYGNSTTGDSFLPIIVGNQFTRIFTGEEHCFGIRKDGTLWGWGRNVYGQLGDGTQIDRAEPVKIGDGFIDVASGNDHTLAIKQDGTAWSWGNNYYGQLGVNTLGSILKPVKFGDNYIQVSASGLNSFGIQDDNTLWSWGLEGMLGTGVQGSNIFHPMFVGENFKKIRAGFNRVLAIKTDDSLWGWGIDGQLTLDNGLIGNALGNFDWLIPQKIGSQYKDAFASDPYCNTAVKLDGSLLVWGRYKGEPNGPVPWQWKIGTQFEQLSGGINFYVGRKTDGSHWAWGENEFGQLGIGSAIDHFAPVRVAV
jgi:alpha-tubulin suppressor-like RCC1 family protein